MAFSLGFGSGKSSSSQSTTGTKTTDQEVNQQQSQTGSVVTSQTGSQDRNSTQQSQTSGLSNVLSSEVLTSLDDDTRNALEQLIAQLSSGPTATQSRLDEIALGGGVDTTAIVENARAKSTEKLGVVSQQLARTAGSTQNSIVQQLLLDEQMSMERELASLATELGLQNQTAQVQALTAAEQTRQGSSGAVAALANVLKGSQVQQTGSQTQQTQQSTLQSALETILSSSDSQELRDLLTSLTGSTNTTETIDQTTRGKSKGSSIGLGFSSS